MRQYLGKFEGSGRIGERMHALSLDGLLDDECGSVDETGRWYGIARFRRATVIMTEDSQGFFDCDVYADKDHAESVWSDIMDDMMEAAGPQDDDYVISCNRHGYHVGVQNGGSHGMDETFASMDDALAAIRAEVDATGFSPNAWYVNDHGNADIVSY